MEQNKKIMLLAGILAVGATGEAQPVQKPNIIHIMADDLGWRDPGTYGSETFKTPHIDALAANGMRFSNAYSASPLCSPTRSAILTGLSPARGGSKPPLFPIYTATLLNENGREGALIFWGRILRRRPGNNLPCTHRSPYARPMPHSV